MKFKYIDKITEIEKNKFITGVFTPSFEMITIKRPHERVGSSCPQVLILESLMQLAGRLVHYSTDFTYCGAIVSLQNCIWHNLPVLAGERLEMTLELQSINIDGVYMKNGLVRVTREARDEKDGSQNKFKIFDILKIDSSIGKLFPIKEFFLDKELLREEFNTLLGNSNLKY